MREKDEEQQIYFVVLIKIITSTYLVFCSNKIDKKDCLIKNIYQINKIKLMKMLNFLHRGKALRHPELILLCGSLQGK